MEKNMEKHVYMHITEPLCYTAELTQHCKSTILQFKIENEKKKGFPSVCIQADLKERGEVLAERPNEPARTYTPKVTKRPNELRPHSI